MSAKGGSGVRRRSGFALATAATPARIWLGARSVKFWPPAASGEPPAAVFLRLLDLVIVLTPGQPSSADRRAAGCSGGGANARQEENRERTPGGIRGA